MRGFRGSPQIDSLILGGVEVGHEFRLQLSPDTLLSSPGFLGLDLGLIAVLPANGNLSGGLSVGLRYTPTGL